MRIHERVFKFFDQQQSWTTLPSQQREIKSGTDRSEHHSNRQTTWIVDGHRGDGKRFVVRADEKLTAFLELESTLGHSGELF